MFQQTCFCYFLLFSFSIWVLPPEKKNICPLRALKGGGSIKVSASEKLVKDEHSEEISTIKRINIYIVHSRILNFFCNTLRRGDIQKLIGCEIRRGGGGLPRFGNIVTRRIKRFFWCQGKCPLGPKIMKMKTFGISESAS